MKNLITALAGLGLLTSLAAADTPSVQRGREMFEGTALGTNGKSCAGCHPGGRKLARAGGYDEEQLAEIINQCIKKPLRGQELDPESADMKSLIMYVKTLSKPAGKP